MSTDSYNIKKYNAYSVFWNAIIAGKIIKPKICSICGKTNCIIEGHHKDYSKPLDVIWCCKKCHSILDKERRRRNNIKIVKEKPKELLKTGDISVRILPKTKIELLAKLKKKGYNSFSEFFSEIIRKFLNNK